MSVRALVWFNVAITVCKVDRGDEAAHGSLESVRSRVITIPRRYAVRRGNASTGSSRSTGVSHVPQRPWANRLVARPETSGVTGSPWDAGVRAASWFRCRACLLIFGGWRGAAEGARRKGRSAVLRACGLRDLRESSRSFALDAGFCFHCAGIDVLAPMASGDRGRRHPRTMVLRG